ncbi:MAG: hypothetical protein BroJett011_54370 [Chloroflexota bacterium]|nr:MAG: hypothetical protein BroJett011_54370 [Chloroflexota bacterium]
MALHANSLLLVALLFLIINIIALRVILALNRRKETSAAALPILPGEPLVAAADILSWEFEYARITASEAMAERHTIVNFYLLVAGVVTSGVVALLARETGLPTAIGAALFWVLVGIGWIYFLAIIRLRQAWYGSAQAMNRIKEFCIEHARSINPATLRAAFLWQPHTLPAPDKPWTVFFYAAMLIGLLNSAAFVAGGALLNLEITLSNPWQILGPLSLSGCAFFAFHIWLYFAFLHEDPKHAQAGPAEKHQAEEPSVPARQTITDYAGVWVKILEETEEYKFGTLFRIIRAQLQYRRCDGCLSKPITRINFERGDSVGVLLYDPQANAVILVRQFRYPVYAGLEPDQRAGQGARQAWLLEIVAGVKDEGHSVREVANKELLEEAGYKVKGELQPLIVIYPSPGGSSERIHLFLGQVDTGQRAGQGGGVVAEGEDTQMIELPFQEAMDMVARGQIQDAKTIIALQHLALCQAGRADFEVGTV